MAASEISSDAQAVIAGAPQGFQEYAMANAPGNKLTSGEATRLLSQFQSSSPYSGQNVVSAVASPAPGYNYEDPYGARTAIEKQLGYDEAMKGESTAQSNLLGFQDTTRAQINTLRDNRNLSTGLEAGFEATRIREATQQEQVLSNQLTLAQNKRLALENKVNQYYDIYRSEKAAREAAMVDALQYGADVNIGMSLKDIVKAGSGAKQKMAEKEKDDAYKQSLKEIAIQYGLKTKGSTKDLEKRIGKYNKDALKEAQEMNDLKFKSANLDIQQQQLQIQKLSESLGGNDLFSGVDWGSAYSAYQSVTGGNGQSSTTEDYNNFKSNSASSFLQSLGF